MGPPDAMRIALQFFTPKLAGERRSARLDRLNGLLSPIIPYLVLKAAAVTAKNRPLRSSIPWEANFPLIRYLESTNGYSPRCSYLLRSPTPDALSKMQFALAVVSTSAL